MSRQADCTSTHITPTTIRRQQPTASSPRQRTITPAHLANRNEILHRLIITILGGIQQVLLGWSSAQVRRCTRSQCWCPQRHSSHHATYHTSFDTQSPHLGDSSSPRRRSAAGQSSQGSLPVFQPAHPDHKTHADPKRRPTLISGAAGAAAPAGAAPAAAPAPAAGRASPSFWLSLARKAGSL